MKDRGLMIPLSVLTSLIVLAACVEIPTGDDELLSFQLNSLPSPSVVVGDTLRDSLGVATPLSVSAFNFRGEIISNPGARFTALDRRVRVDSITGFVIGDSAGTTARIIARVDEVTSTVQIPVVLRPDTVVGSNARDSLSYSLTDTASNISTAIGVRVLHGPAAGDSAVSSFLVSFQILSPADTALARLVDQNGRVSLVDTTDASGIAGRRVKVTVARLTAQVDSVVVRANVRYRGVHVRGSPVRLVLKVKPR